MKLISCWEETENFWHVCGIDSATATYSCIWCTCSKSERHLDKQWSIVDEECGAWTVKGIKEAAALSKGSKKKIQVFKPSTA